MSGLYKLFLPSVVAAVASLMTISCQNTSPETARNKNPSTFHSLQATASTAPAPTTLPAFLAPVGLPYLVNAHVVTDKLISGAQPEGDDAFRTLRDLGIKTVISVDGSQPDLALAHKYGLRYVHIPTTYDGVTPEQGRMIAKAIDELPGPIYLHCHHGKHRSASVVAVACVYAGTLKPEQAETVLKTFGTGTNYKGLWKDALAARPLPKSEIDATKIDFVEAAKTEKLVQLMVKVDEHNDALKLIKKAGWQTLSDSPDLDAAHEALLLQEQFAESARLPSHADRPDDYKQMLKDAENASTDLAAALRTTPKDVPGADAAFAKVAASCTACHKIYRD